MEVEIKVEGFKELMEQLETLCSPGVQKKLVEGSVKQAAKIVKSEAERNLGKGPGHIAVGTPKKRTWGTDTAAAVGVGVTKEHWEDVFIEYGTSEHKVIAGERIRKGSIITGLRKKGRFRHGLGGEKEFWTGSGKKVLADVGRGLVFGKWAVIPAQAKRPFLRPALDSKKNEVLGAMRKFLQLALDAIIEHRQKNIPEV